MSLRILAITLLSLALTACTQVVNRGPVAGADLLVAPLRGGAPLYTVTTSTPASVIAAEGDAAWNAGSDTRRLQQLGRADLPGDLPLDAADWYLVTASGGSDFDIDADGRLESDVGTPVQGSLHAIVRGEQLLADGVAVSPLTEAAYRFVVDYLPELTDAELEETLDTFAADLVSDTDISGVVEYRDLLLANRLYALENTLPGQAAAVDALAEAIADGAADERLRELALAISSRGAPGPIAEAVYAATIHQSLVETYCAICHVEGGWGERASANRVVRDDDPEYASKNTENFRNLLGRYDVAALAATPRGVGHGGGRVVPEGDPVLDAFEAWLKLL
ncbi:MAG: hypothetical protein V2I66_02075 [Halieaceae bacterium]|jgi:hypothetical protein|nr:hypothetical protein [Halieaceae bacterium]